ncbi:hypothetical protein AAG570_007702 [Ranatra chinensis]|uniref:GPI mannosyltransferase 2 n=1 Tax=Ranatra chinensis TaxID=642074 RepID=A0ABD0XUI8_9HEMI
MSKWFRSVGWSLRAEARKYALASRFFFLALSALFNLLFPDHHSRDAFQAPGFNLTTDSVLDNCVRTGFGGLLRWDAHHFMHIAQYGYSYENNTPFLPMFPAVVRFLSTTLCAVLHVIEYPAILLCVAIAVNIFCFVKASDVLYELSCKISGNEAFAFKSVVFFCVSPASVFFIAPYSESMYTLATFSGMLCCLNNHFGKGTFWFALSTLVRSNGITNIWFVFYFSMSHFFHKFVHKGVIIRAPIWSLYNILWSNGLAALLILSPFVAFQLYVYDIFCPEIKIDKDSYPSIVMDYALENNLTLSFNKPDWCNAKFSIPYFSVQKKYWHVGFLNYFVLKQIPNFLLALPMISLVLYYGIGFLRSILLYKFYGLSRWKISLILPDLALPFCAHAVILTVYALFNINVQVTTRLIASSNPFIYWIASAYFVYETKLRGKGQYNSFINLDLFPLTSIRKSGNLIGSYFILYAFIGILAFSNNFPWT